MSQNVAVEQIATKMELLSDRLKKAQRRMSAALGDLQDNGEAGDAPASPPEAACAVLAEVCHELQTLTSRAVTIGADLDRESARRTGGWQRWRGIDDSVDIPFTD